MRKLIFALFLATMLTSCMTYQGFYNVGLQEVERPENAKERYGESKIINFEEEGKTKYSYEDELIKIVWLPLSTQFAFTLENKSDNSIKIIWDEAVYVDENGSSGRVMHSGVKYVDRSNPQPPTVVVKKAKVDDMVVPTDNIYYISGQYGGWQTKPLFPNRATTQEELNVLTQKYVGKTVKILLPLQIQETVNEYIFSFKVENFISK
ncbi:MAG: membrane lipoprotein lipid attachment site-containing protein [Bacteroidales bacterium]|nr:membrane lipoprotein lipid attachment site-containing protein [Bacteroidales bacterium]